MTIDMVAAVEAPLGHNPQLDIGLRLTAVALLLRPMGPWFVRPLILAIAVLMLVAPQKLRSPRAWLLIAAMVTVRIADDWPLSDNHIYLLGYWALAIGLALRASNPAGTVAVTSRRLLGLAFAFAVIWKAFLSPDFLDGRFFRVTLLTDPRFGDAAQLVGGLSADELAANREALSFCRTARNCSTHRQSTNRYGCARWRRRRRGESSRSRQPSRCSCWRKTMALARLRHAALLLFCAITYLFAPVAGFGWLLLAMGVAQLERRQRALRRAYIAAFVVVIFYGEIPWAELTLGALGR